MSFFIRSENRKCSGRYCAFVCLELLQAYERTLEVISITIDTVNSDLENVGVLLGPWPRRSDSALLVSGTNKS